MPPDLKILKIEQDIFENFKIGLKCVVELIEAAKRKILDLGESYHNFNKLHDTFQTNLEIFRDILLNFQNFEVRGHAVGDFEVLGDKYRLGPSNPRTRAGEQQLRYVWCLTRSGECSARIQMFM